MHACTFKRHNFCRQVSKFFASHYFNKLMDQIRGGKMVANVFCKYVHLGTKVFTHPSSKIPIGKLSSPTVLVKIFRVRFDYNFFWKSCTNANIVSVI